MSPDPHRLCSSYLTWWSNKVWCFLVHSHCLVDVSLHELVLWVRLRWNLNTLVSSLAGVSNAFDSLGLRLHLYITCYTTKWRIWRREVRRIINELLRRLNLLGSCRNLDSSLSSLEVKLLLLHGILQGWWTRIRATRPRVSLLFSRRSTTNNINCCILVTHMRLLKHGTIVQYVLLLLLLQ